MSAFWGGKKVVVTGGNGFLGKHLCGMLEKSGAIVVVADIESHDLRQYHCAHHVIEGDIVFHLAARVGGILDNIAHPADFIHDNLAIGLNVLKAAHEAGVKRVVVASSACAYPKDLEHHFEEDLWHGHPEESNGPYGVSKRVLVTLSAAYRKQHGMNVTTLIPTNMYGPGDCLDLKRSHVIPAVIQKIYKAHQEGSDFVMMMGSGQARRDFLYVEDAAQAFMDCAERCDAAGPFNIGSGSEVGIDVLARKIANFIGFRGAILWDHEGPDGQMSRMLNIKKAQTAFGFETKTSLDKGLERTVEWTLGVLAK